jgi:hypothetical protein
MSKVRLILESTEQIKFTDSFGASYLCNIVEKDGDWTFLEAFRWDDGFYRFIDSLWIKGSVTARTIYNRLCQYTEVPPHKQGIGA